MTLPTNDNEKPMNREEPQHAEFERLTQEINLLKLEGHLFCFDPREARRRRGSITLADARKQPVTIKVDSDYGQPSVLAYKILQAIFLKLDEQGCTVVDGGQCLYNAEVAFTQRELSRMVGRVWSGKKGTEELFRAIMQLRRTSVIASLYDKTSDQWQVSDFDVLISSYFSGKGNTLSSCSVQLHPVIMASLNKNYVAFFNHQRLQKLEPIGLVLYKQVFFNLSKQMHGKKGRPNLSYHKDYENICSQCLGGLKPQRYRADIVKQLGPHLDALISTGLISRYAISKNAGETGFNITFFAGQAFFEDYEAYYVKRPKPRAVAQVADTSEIAALRLVAQFHRALGRTHVRFDDHETEYAKQLLAKHSEADLRDLIAYALGEAEKTKFEMRLFNGLKVYAEAWASNQARRAERARRQAAVKACPLCNEAGMLELKRQGTSEYLAHPCPHHVEHVVKIEERLNAHRI